MAKLVGHLKHAHGIERAFSCDECGKAFRSPMNIARHKLIHTGLKKFACELCDYASNQKSNLDCHRRRHANDYAYRCEQCDKRFLAKAEYMGHVNVHTRSKLYRCDHCDKCYPYKKNLTVHLHARHADVAGSVESGRAGEECRNACQICSAGFAYKRLLERHMKQQHGLADATGSKFLCELCGTLLSSKRRLQVHTRGHTDEKVANCDVCGKGFASKENLTIHRRTHTSEKPHACPHCGRAFAQRTSLVLHLRYHSGQRPYRCTDCAKGFVSGTLLKKHRKLHDKIAQSIQDSAGSTSDGPDNGTKFEATEKACELCQEKFHFVTRLVAHLRIAHGIDRPFKCATCEKTYPQQFMLNAHVKKSHTPKTVPCAKCSFMGVNAIDVERHGKRRHREIGFTCEICNETFREKESFTTHTTSLHSFMQCRQRDAYRDSFDDVSSRKEQLGRAYHYDPSTEEKGTEKLADKKPEKTPPEGASNEQPVARPDEQSDQRTGQHRCDACGKVYKYRSVLKQHQAKAHADKPGGHERRRYLCALCGKELKTAKGLEIHNRSHTGEKPYTCEVCGKCFACETLLRTHNVTHTGERKYSCEQCGKAFTQRSTLVVHKRYHTGERPYVCPRCGKGFVTRTVLNTHLKSCR